MTKRQSEGGPPSPPQSSLAARGILIVPTRVPRVAGGRTVHVFRHEVLSNARISRSAYIPPRLVGRRRVEPSHSVANYSRVRGLYRRLRLRKKELSVLSLQVHSLTIKPITPKNCIVTVYMVFFSFFYGLHGIIWYYM